MNTPIPFDPRPELLPRHRKALSFGNEKLLRAWIASPRKPEDIERAILIELERGDRARRVLLRQLVIFLFKTRRRAVERMIEKHLKKILP